MKNLAYDVDGSEIPFPTTWHGAETFKIHGRFYQASTAEFNRISEPLQQYALNLKHDSMRDS